MSQIYSSSLCTFSLILSLPTRAPSATLAGTSDIPVLGQTVVVLVLALVGGTAVIVGPGGRARVKVAAVAARLAKELVPEVGLVAAARGLAALGVGVDALVVLDLAGVGAGVAALGTRVAVTLVGVDLGVELEGVLGVVVLEIVAGHDGQLDAADGVAGAVAVEPRAGLLADVGHGGDGALGGSGRGRGGGGLLGSCACRSARDRDRLGGRGVSLGRVLGDAVTLAKLGDLQRADGTVVVNVTAPAGEVEALKGCGPTSVLEAGSKLDLAVGKSSLAAGLIVKVGELLVAPATALVLASRRNSGGGVADGGRGAGGPGGSGRRPGRHRRLRGGRSGGLGCRHGRG